MPQTPADRDEVAHLLSEQRSAPYRTAVGGNLRDALSLYQWHTGLSAALHEQLGVAEVVLRNAMDQQLRIWHQARTGREDWLIEDANSPIERPLRDLTKHKREQATSWARSARGHRSPSHPRRSANITHDDVLANITFGLWRELLPNHARGANPNEPRNRGRQILWDQALIHAFPNTTDPTGTDTYWQVSRLHHLRNRVAHMEPLLDIDVEHRVRDLLELVGSVSIPTRNWLSGSNRVPGILKTRPI